MGAFPRNLMVFAENIKTLMYTFPFEMTDFTFYHQFALEKKRICQQFICSVQHFQLVSPMNNAASRGRYQGFRRFILALPVPLSLHIDLAEV